MKNICSQMKMFSEAKCSSIIIIIICRKKRNYLQGNKSVKEDDFIHRLNFVLQMKLPTRLCKKFHMKKKIKNSKVIYLPQAIKLTIGIDRRDNDE